MKTVLGIILIIAFGLLAFGFFLLIDIICFDGTKLKDIQYENACGFEVPKEWKIVSDGKYFAVQKVSDGEKQFLSDAVLK